MNRTAIVSGALMLVAALQADATIFESWTRASLQFTNLGRAEASATATGLVTVTTSSSTSSHLSTVTLPFEPGLSLDTAIPVTDPAASPATSVILSAIRGRPDLAGGILGNISGAVASAVAGILPNTIPGTGGRTVCLLIAPLDPCVAQLALGPVGATSVGIPIGLGVGGILTIGGTGSLRFSFVGAPYTVKTVSVVNRTANGGFDVLTEVGFAHGPASLTSSTAGASGVLQVVTASRTTVVGFASDFSGSISRVLLHLAPEADLALLLGAGSGALFLLGYGRRQR